jgi:AraC-like DNA-binding protein
MVSLRCKMVVKAALDELEILYRNLELGEVNTIKPITAEQIAKLKAILAKSGLELMDDKKAMLIEKIKTIVIEMVHYADDGPHVNFSELLSEKLSYDYTYLADLFSQATGTTIGQYIIAHKIEKVKELLLYDELNLTEISYKLNYSSVAHLSNQFKKVTGLTPSFFKQLKKHKNRIALEDI